MPDLRYIYKLALTERKEIEAMIYHLETKEDMNNLIDYINVKLQEAFEIGKKVGGKINEPIG